MHDEVVDAKGSKLGRNMQQRMTHRTAKVSGFSYAYNLILSELPKISQKPLTEKVKRFCLLNFVF